MGTIDLPKNTRYAAGRAAELLRSMGGLGQFNTGEIETSQAPSVPGDLEALIDRLLRQDGAGAFRCEGGPGSIVKCIFRDNALKPATVSDVKLAISIAEPDCAADFKQAAALLEAALGRGGLNYQFAENRQGDRELAIREYENADAGDLPDERFQIRLKYFDADGLARECALYDGQIANFISKVQHLWDLIEAIYQDSKSVFKVNDFEDLARKNKSRIRDLAKKKTGEPAYDVSGEAGFDKGRIRLELARMQERIKNMYEFLYPVERRSMEERLDWLEQEFSRVDFIVNPRHLAPGLLIEADMTTIKRKRTTADAMAAALHEFLHGLMNRPS